MPTTTPSRVRWFAAALATTIAVAAAGCSDGQQPASGAGTTVGPDPIDVVAAPSEGCGAREPVGPGEQRVTMPSGEQERWYIRHVPEAHDGSTPIPLVIDLHGYAEGAEVHVRMSGLGALGDREDFVTLTPQGRGRVPRWDTALGGEDLAFFGGLLDEAEATLCVDTNRIFVTGLSNGAFMTSAVACQYADRVAAVAPVAGIRLIDGCDPARAVPVVAFHGTDDQFVSFEGGFGPAVANLPPADDLSQKVARGGMTGTRAASSTTTSTPTSTNGSTTGSPADDPSVPEIVAAWAERNGCDPTPAEESIADDVAVVRYPCPAGADVELYRIEGGGHAWPGSELSASVGSVVGHTTMSISANEVMWDFFVNHPLTSTVT